MKAGDKVTGIPSELDMQKKYPTVTGYFDQVPWEFMGEMELTDFVIVNGVAISCDNIRLASRREKITELS